MRRVELREKCGSICSAVRLSEADRQSALCGASGLDDRLTCRRRSGERPTGLSEERQSRDRELDVAGRTNEECASELPLESPDRPGQARSNDVTPGRRPVEVALLGYCNEMFQLPKFHYRVDALPRVGIGFTILRADAICNRRRITR